MNLSKFCLTLGVTALVPALGAVAGPAAAVSFSRIYSFGDSLVDTGNTFALTEALSQVNLPGLPPVTPTPPPPYFDGRFSNGRLWNEYLAADLGIPQTSFGFGGALTGELGLLLFNGAAVTPVPGLLAQVNTFAANPAGADPDALYILWAGANDYLFADITNPSGPVSNLTSAVSTLNAAGAENFLLVNLPDLGRLPLIASQGDPATIAGLNALTAAHNQTLATAVATLDQQAAIAIDLLDANALLASAFAGGFDLTNTSSACTLVPSCVSDSAVQESFLFWDQVHPTTAAHRLLANAALAQFEQAHPEPIPEPSQLLGLSLLGLVGIGYRRHRQTAP